MFVNFIGIFIINNLIKDDANFILFAKFQEMFYIHINFFFHLQWYHIITWNESVALKEPIKEICDNKFVFKKPKVSTNFTLNIIVGRQYPMNVKHIFIEIDENK